LPFSVRQLQAGADGPHPGQHRFEATIMTIKTAAALSIICALLISPLAAAGDVAAGKARAATCLACHGVNGIGTQPIYPNLAGQKEAYLVQALKGFKSGERKNAIMNAMAAALSDSDIENLAAYYGSLTCQ
jgi:cytochrome c553